ncbi:MAG TPA: hypothetical protein VGR28_12400, partial [Candidatus Thermoplasmatota archaeon]|nr:hypothetical protein [Candidatus Thermoplasmatota archaeon]
MKRGAALLLLGLMVAPMLPAPLPSVPGAGAQPAALPDVTYSWWDEAWHMRAPILMLPQLQDRVNGGIVDLGNDFIFNYPATAEIDFTKAIRESNAGGFGWPQDAQGRLSSFTFDLHSVRVVEYDRFKGCPLVRDRSTGATRCFQSGDKPTDALVPTTVSPGLWENPLNVNPVFDAERNAVATLQWIIKGRLNAPRQYFVYFDIQQNGLKAAPSFRPEEQAALDGLQWVRAGTDIFGFVPAPSTTKGPGVILAQALYDKTTIAMYKYTTLNGGIEPAIALAGKVNAGDTSEPENFQWGTCPLTSTYEGTVCLEAPVGETFFFRVLANKPVVVSLMTLDNFGGGT